MSNQSPLVIEEVCEHELEVFVRMFRHFGWHKVLAHIQAAQHELRMMVGSSDEERVCSPSDPLMSEGKVIHFHGGRNG